MDRSSYKLFQIQTTKRRISAAAFLDILCHDSRYKYDRKSGHNRAASFWTSPPVSSVLLDLLCENWRMQKCCTVLSLIIVWIQAWWLSVGSLTINTFCTNLSSTAEVISRVKISISLYSRDWCLWLTPPQYTDGSIGDHTCATCDNQVL